MFSGFEAGVLVGGGKKFWVLDYEMSFSSVDSVSVQIYSHLSCYHWLCELESVYQKKQKEKQTWKLSGGRVVYGLLTRDFPLSTLDTVVVLV